MQLKKLIISNRYLSWLLIISNWLFQGIIHADKLEKIYKISFTFILSIIIFIYSFFFLNDNPVYSIIISFIIAHTLNWILNNSLIILTTHRLHLTTLNKDRTFDYLNTLANRVIVCNCFMFVSAHGSICRGELKATSDVDISLVRLPGFKNAFKSLIFYVREQKLADFYKIPLEIYLCDTPQNAKDRFFKEAQPVAIYNPESIILKYFNSVITIDEALILNGLKK